jgi:ATP-binding cassette subfamily C protein
MDCDRILVLEKGTIVESGTYDELMKKEAYFYKYAKRQLV